MVQHSALSGLPQGSTSALQLSWDGQNPCGKSQTWSATAPHLYTFPPQSNPTWSCRSRVLPTTSNCVPGVYERAATLPPQHCLHFSLCTVVTMWQIYSAPKPSSATAKGHFLMKPCHSYQPQLPAQAVTQGSARERLPDYRHSKAQTLPCST